MEGGALIALGPNKLSSYLIIRFVVFDALPHPLPVRMRARSSKFRSGLKQAGEAICPEIHIFGRTQERLNQLVPFLWISLGDELTHAIGRREGSGQIQADPAQEFRIAGDLGRNDIKLSQ